MESQELKCSLKITRFTSTRKPYSGINIAIQDTDSRVCIAELTLSPEEFSNAITGLNVDDIHCSTFVKDNRIGKKKVSETRELYCPYMYKGIDFYRQFLTDCVELAEGEYLSFYPGSHSSIRPCAYEEGTILRYTVYRYEDVK